MSIAFVTANSQAFYYARRCQASSLYCYSKPYGLQRSESDIAARQQLYEDSTVVMNSENDIDKVFVPTKQLDTPYPVSLS